MLFRSQSFPASGSFPVSQLFTSGSQSIGASASASVLPMNMLSSSVMSNSLQTYGLQSGSSVCWDTSGKNTGMGHHALLQGIFPMQGSNPGLPHCRQISLPAEPPGKPKNTGVGSLSLLQGIFLIQELKWGFLHCRRILYQLSYTYTYISSFMDILPI